MMYNILYSLFMIDDMLKVALVCILMVLGLCALCIIVGEIFNCEEEQPDEAESLEESDNEERHEGKDAQPPSSSLQLRVTPPSESLPPRSLRGEEQWTEYDIDLRPRKRKLPDV